MSTVSLFRFKGASHNRGGEVKSKVELQTEDGRRWIFSCGGAKNAETYNAVFYHGGAETWRGEGGY